MAETGGLQLRRHKRYKLKWQVRVRGDGVAYDLDTTTVDLSRSGAFLFVEDKLEIGMRLRLTFDVPGEDEQLTTFARVVRTISMKEAENRDLDPGVGTQFFASTPAFNERIALLLPEDEDDLGDLDVASPTIIPDMLADGWAGSGNASGPRVDTQLKDPANLHKQVTELIDRSEYLKAHEKAILLVDLDPSNEQYKVSFHLASAGIYKDKGDLDQAVIHWRRATSIDPFCAVAVQELRDAGVGRKRQDSLLSSLFGRLGKRQK